MRGDDAFAPDTINKVQRIANEMGYRPNRLVASIQAGKTQTIGVMVPPQGDFFGRVLAGIHAKLAHNDYIPLHLWATPELPEREQIHRLLDRRVDGMILFASDDTAPDPFIEEVWRRNIPAVSVDRLIKGSPADFVGTDDVLGGELAAKHLLKLGHRNVMHLAARPDISTSNGRWRGFKKIIGARRGAKTAYAVADDFYSGYELAMEFLSKPSRPSAVFCGNDYLAVDTLRAARDLASTSRTSSRSSASPTCRSPGPPSPADNPSPGARVDRPGRRPGRARPHLRQAQDQVAPQDHAPAHADRSRVDWAGSEVSTARIT